MALGVNAFKEFLPMKPGDVPGTAADTSAMEAWTGSQHNSPYAKEWLALWPGAASFTECEGVIPGLARRRAPLGRKNLM